MENRDLERIRENDLHKLYPTDLLVTGFDIIFFWVARMVLMGMYNLKEEPFEKVYIHGLIRDKEGQKMSKTKGNVVDPLDMIAKYGTDALRFSLAIQTVPGSDIKFDESRVEGYKHFANKIWNASRYVLMNLPEDFKLKDISQTELEPEDKWILYLLNETVKKVREGLESYDFSKSAQALYTFFWDFYCDWYIEFTKERVYKGEEKSREAAFNTLIYVLDRALKLLHPFMPYITEEIWSYMPTKNRESISLAEYPKPVRGFEEYEETAKEVDFVRDVITSIRNFKTMLELPVTKKLEAYFKGENELINALLKSYKAQIERLARLEKFEKTEQRPEKSLVIPIKGGEIYISVEGVINVEEVLTKQRKKKEKLIKELKKVEAKLQNPKFLERAPREIVEKEKRIHEELKLELEKIENLLKLLSS
jgi:valyl-tRNA synthetase